MSRLDLARDAIRPALKGRIMLSGPSGSGKTRTGLIIATVLAAESDGSIVVIDTEKNSALTYADDFTFKHVRWLPPYDPRELAQNILEAGDQYAVTICDSASHFWRKAGGTLDIADGKFGGWKTARPAQEDLVDAVLDSNGHVILCCRSAEAHVQETENGRTVVRKLGLEPQQDATLMYEVNVGLEIDMEHRLTVSKSRSTAVPVGKFFHPGHAGDFAEVYRDWLRAGEPPAPHGVVEDLEHRINALPERVRKACKEDFFARHGRPSQLRESATADAEALVVRYETEAGGAEHVEPDPEPPDGAGGGENTKGAGDDGPASGGDAAPSGDGADGHDVGRTEPEPAPAALNARDIAKKASLVFKTTVDEAPRGKKKLVGDRLRHAVVYATTRRRTSSASDLDGPELLRAWQRLDDIAEGRLSYTADPVDDDGAITFHLQSGDLTLTWAEIDTTHSAGEAA